MYAIKLGDECVKELKGIKNSVIKHEILFDDYVNCRKTGNYNYHQDKCIRFCKHKVYSICVNKLSLSADDYKHVVMTDGVNTLPYEHYTLFDENEPPAKKL
ncbi:hypothetical protein C0J52_07390 [Blattella germanica]|nr:hypothetical protein C0J52_07390 [Blattella germanica]